MIKYNFALEILEIELKLLLTDYEYRNKYNPVEHIKSRIKSDESIKRKLEERGYDDSPNNISNHINDVVGIRIVCSFLSDVYNIVDLVKKSNRIKIKEEKDYIQSPKETGYRSYHINVLVPIILCDREEEIEAEIQIRTIAMDFWAALDHKIQYKFPKRIPAEIKREMCQCSEDIREIDEKMLNISKIMKNYVKS